MASLSLSNAGVRLPVFQSGKALSVLGSAARAAVGGTLRRSSSAVIEVEALKEINLQVAHGERVGVIGHNGAGKTTFLRLVAGLIYPASGRVSVVGKTLAILNVNAGMDPEITGRANVDYVGRLFGLEKSEREDLARDVEKFSELGDYFDMPVSSYSAGMSMRLAFGVYTGIESDILVIDEVIGAGDASFQEKAVTRVSDAIGKASILLMATHSYSTLIKHCSRAIHLDSGRIVADGHPEDVWRGYIG